MLTVVASVVLLLLLVVLYHDLQTAESLKEVHRLLAQHALAIRRLADSAEKPKPADNGERTVAHRPTVTAPAPPVEMVEIRYLADDGHEYGRELIPAAKRGAHREFHGHRYIASRHTGTHWEYRRDL